jgi:glycolate oxidase FAD binding subunit
MRVGAGTRLVELRAHAAAEGWELPLDSPGVDATLGGTIATAVTGPRAHAFGPVKDAILGLEVVGGDGVATRCGGRVVKNVTGYDLAKLYCGSFGSFSIVTAAWLRLRPAPGAREVLAASSSVSRDALTALQRFSARSSVRALVWQRKAGEARAWLTVELGGSPESVAADRAALSALVDVETVAPDRLDAVRDQRARPTRPFALHIRVLGSHLYEMAEIAHAAGLDVSIDVGLAAVHAEGALSDPDLVTRIRERAVRFGGHLRVEVMPRACQGSIDVFGELGGAEPIVRSLKQRFDPAGILSPGRFLHRASGGERG